MIFVCRTVLVVADRVAEAVETARTFWAALRDPTDPFGLSEMFDWEPADDSVDDETG
jgi:hypothetical protein